MKCLQDSQDLSVWGNYNSEAAANFMAVFIKCDPALSTVTCKSEEDIRTWLQSKYFVAYWNSKRFLQHKFGSERVDATASTYWFPLSTTTRIDYVT